MKRLVATCFIACGLLFPISSLSQAGRHISSRSQPFGLKRDLLGESIQDFRSRNDRTIRTRPDAPLVETKHLPQCTNDPINESKYETLSIDVDATGETDEEQRAGVVKCIVALSPDDGIGFDDPGPTVAGISAYRTVYYFFRGHLYKIESDLPNSQYRELRKAFVVKYGAPLRAQIIKYQNGFGAEFVGERLLWRNSTSSISIGELDGESNNIRLVFWSDAIGKECNLAGEVKGAGKDL